MRVVLHSKIYKAKVTDVKPDHIGSSITIDKDIIDQDGIFIHEKVQIVNNNNGARFETYVIEGKSGSGVLCLNGAAARLVQPGDKVIIMAYAQMTPEEAQTHKPVVLLLGDNNQILEKLSERAGQIIE